MPIETHSSGERIEFDLWKEKERAFSLLRITRAVWEISEFNGWFPLFFPFVDLFLSLVSPSLLLLTISYSRFPFSSLFVIIINIHNNTVIAHFFLLTFTLFFTPLHPFFTSTIKNSLLYVGVLSPFPQLLKNGGNYWKSSLALHSQIQLIFTGGVTHLTVMRGTFRDRIDYNSLSFSSIDVISLHCIALSSFSSLQRLRSAK